MNFIEEVLRDLELRQARITCAIAALRALDPQEWKAPPTAGKEATKARPVQPRAVKKPAGAPASKAETVPLFKKRLHAALAAVPVSAQPLRKGDIRDRVLRHLRTTGSASARALADAVGLDLGQIRPALVKLHKRGLVTLAGKTNHATWSAVPQKPTSRPGDPELESVWNGAKERAGQAPGLSSVGRG